MAYTLAEYAAFQLTAARRRLASRMRSLMNALYFNSQPPEGGWLIYDNGDGVGRAFQLTAARRRLGILNAACMAATLFQLTAARRRLVPPLKPLTGKACIALFR